MRDLLCSVSLDDRVYITSFKLDKPFVGKTDQYLEDDMASIVCELMMEHSDYADITYLEHKLTATFRGHLLFCDLSTAADGTFLEGEHYDLNIDADITCAQRPAHFEHIGKYILVPIHVAVFRNNEPLIDMRYTANIPVQPYLKRVGNLMKGLGLEHTYNDNVAPKRKYAANACEAMAMDPD